MMSEHWFWTCREKFQQIAGLVITFAGMGWVREILKPMQASSNYATTSNVKQETTCEVTGHSKPRSKISVTQKHQRHHFFLRYHARTHKAL